MGPVELGDQQMVAIQTRNLSRTFDEVVAVDDLDLEVHTGEVYGFLGPNGAGKSTTINMLLGFVPPSDGSGTVLGHDIATESLALRRRTGVLPEDFGVYDRLTARKHVEFAIETKAADDDPEVLLERVGLADAIDRKAGGFSKGMAQRLALAMALAGDPDLLLLDEPSTGLDPNGAREMRSIIRQEVDRGATVFFSSHILGQVEAICDRVGVLREGRLVAEDTIEGLRSEFDSAARLIVTIDEPTDDIVTAVRSTAGVVDVRIEEADIVVSLERDDRKAPVINAIEDAGGTITDITSADPSLEDLFAALTTDGDGTDLGVSSRNRSPGRPRATEGDA